MAYLAMIKCIISVLPTDATGSSKKSLRFCRFKSSDFDLKGSSSLNCHSFESPPQTKGALQPGSFYTPNHKTAHYGCIFWPSIGQKYCNLSCCKLASKQNSNFMKNAQNHVNCEVKPNFGKKQLEPKSVPIAFSICFSQSNHTLHALYQKIPPFLRFPIIPRPCPPGPFHPWILSLFHPFTQDANTL